LTADPPREPLRYRYQFEFQDGSTRDIDLELDYETLELRHSLRDSYPSWTELRYEKCRNCPLDEQRHERCPVAANLVDVVDMLTNRVSYEEVEVTVETEGRRYSKRTSLQQAAGSLIGIYNVASGCPVLSKLRPMVATHLPFMTSDESTYRMIATYLMAQYFIQMAGGEADLELAGFLDFLEEARHTNADFSKRLQTLGAGDASLNALSNLNAMGEIASLSVETHDLKRWERMFLRHYLGEDPREKC